MRRVHLIVLALLMTAPVVVVLWTVPLRRRSGGGPAMAVEGRQVAPTTLEGLVSAFRRTYDARDLDGMLNLFYYAGVDSATRASLRRELAIDLDAGRHVDSIVVKDAGSTRVNRFTVRGTTYAPNLPVVKELDVYFPKSVDGVTSDGFNVGTLEGGYYLVTVAPVSLQPAAPVFTSRYTNRRYGIALRYTDDYRIAAGIDGRLFTETDLTFNHAEPVVTLVYSAPRFPGTSYAGAGIAVWKVAPPEPLGCRTMGAPVTNRDTGVSFYEGAGAATDGAISKKDSFYLVSHGSDCFKLDARVMVNTAREATALSAQDKVDLLEAMDAVARTLEFTR